MVNGVGALSRHLDDRVNDTQDKLYYQQSEVVDKGDNSVNLGRHFAANVVFTVIALCSLTSMRFFTCNIVTIYEFYNKRFLTQPLSSNTPKKLAYIL